MTSVEMAALIAAMAFVALVALLAVMLMKLHATISTVQAAVSDLHRSTVPLLENLRGTVNSLNVELDRVDGILASAESVASSASNVAGLVSNAVSNPLVKAIAFLAGTGAAYRAVRKKAK